MLSVILAPSYTCPNVGTGHHHRQSKESIKSGILRAAVELHIHPLSLRTQFFGSKKGIPWSNSNQYHILNLPPFLCQGSKGTFHLAPVMALAWPFLDFCWAEGHSGTCATFQ